MQHEAAVVDRDRRVKFQTGLGRRTAPWPSARKTDGISAQRRSPRRPVGSITLHVRSRRRATSSPHSSGSFIVRVGVGLHAIEALHLARAVACTTASTRSRACAHRRRQTCKCAPDPRPLRDDVVASPAWNIVTETTAEDNGCLPAAMACQCRGRRRSGARSDPRRGAAYVERPLTLRTMVACERWCLPI